MSPWYPASWLRDFIGTVDVEDRVRWAETFGRVLGSLSPDGVVAAWNVWLDAYWSDRNTGVPTPLGLDERQAVVGWLPVLRPILKEAVQRLLERPPEQLKYYTFHLLLQSGIGESHGRDTGRLVAGLMGSLSDLEHDSEVFDLAKQALDHGADPNDIEAIAEHMARFGIGDATVLRAPAVAAREPT